VQYFLVRLVHATFWLGIEQCSNRRQNDLWYESGHRFACHTYQKWSRFMAPVSGACVTGMTVDVVGEW